MMGDGSLIFCVMSNKIELIFRKRVGDAAYYASMTIAAIGYYVNSDPHGFVYVTVSPAFSDSLTDLSLNPFSAEWVEALD